MCIRDRIYTKQLELLGGVESAELSAVNSQISEKQQAIRDCLADNCQGIVAPDAHIATDSNVTQGADSAADLLTLEKDLTALMAQRDTLLRQGVQADAALNSLYTEEEAKKGQLSEYTSEVAAKGNGLVSFYFDGYEQVLSADKLDVVNADLINKVLSSASAGSVTGSENLLYRLVDPEHWYIAFVTARDQAFRVTAGQEYAVRVAGYSDKLFMGTALEPVINENGVVNILEFHESIGELISVRAVNVQLEGQMSGLSVPLEAIGFEGGAPVLEVEGQTVALDVLSVNEDTAIIQAKNGAALQAGQRYGK